MDIISKDRIFWSDLKIGMVAVVPRVELTGEPRLTMLARAIKRCDEDPEGVDLSVFYHLGHKAWALQTEYMSIQRKTRLEFGTLPEIIKLFESRLKVSLPEIKVTEYGVGIYLAAGGEITNPWPLTDGETYQVTKIDGEVGYYVASSNAFGQKLVARVSPEDPRLSKAYPPRDVFTKEMWQSLKHAEIDVNVTPAANEPARRKSPRM